MSLQALLQSANFKLQTSDKVQSSKFKVVWNLMFGYSLMFDVWCLNFASKGGF